MKIIIVGCGRMGSELSNQLSGDGHDVTVVDKDPRTFYRLDPSFKGTTVTGHGFDREVLIRAGIERSDALAAVTAGDNTNIITARVAHMVFNVPSVVARLYDPRRAEIYQRLGLQTVSSTRWGVNRVMQLLVHRYLNVAISLGNGEVDVVELEIPPHWVKRTISDVTMPGVIMVAAVTRQGKTWIPLPGAPFHEGDRAALAVQTTTGREQLEKLLALK
jgi:trk system potassium uptake protein TrkA